MHSSLAPEDAKSFESLALVGQKIDTVLKRLREFCRAGLLQLELAERSRDVPPNVVEIVLKAKQAISLSREAC